MRQIYVGERLMRSSLGSVGRYGSLSYTLIWSEDDVSEEILGLSEKCSDLWFSDVTRIRWKLFWDLLEGWPLNDKTYLDMGAELGTPAMKKIKKHIRAYRKGQNEVGLDI
jgi:hypothetical protein